MMFVPVFSSKTDIILQVENPTVFFFIVLIVIGYV